MRLLVVCGANDVIGVQAVSSQGSFHRLQDLHPVSILPMHERPYWRSFGICRTNHLGYRQLETRDYAPHHAGIAFPDFG